jgi:hypothetical protein
MLGFGGHFLTKSPTYSITFTLLRRNRVLWRRSNVALGPSLDELGNLIWRNQPATGPQLDDQAGAEPTVLVVNFLEFVGAGWHTTGDALLANTAADMARRRREAAREH